MWIMANRHFGKLADVWKHAVLTEVLEREPPSRYAETHAGSASYALTRDEERQFGILRFLAMAPRHDALARSGYRMIAASYAGDGGGLYPGSALLAMTVLGDRSSYLLCDLDPDSAAGLRDRSRELGLQRCEVVAADGLAAVPEWLDDAAAAAPGTALVHIDPFDPYARAPGGYSALELAARLADRGTALVYWYGYDQPSEQAWARDELSALTPAPLWCGDVMVTDASGGGRTGNLGRATTPGTGFGIIAANLSEGTLSAAADLGHALADAYAGATLPDGGQGNLVFTCSTGGGGAAGEDDREATGRSAR
jgi:23S rRNA A2030 N6-methylase RlmJ